MKKMRIFGDIHGDLQFVLDNLSEDPEFTNILVGDVGVGFVYHRHIEQFFSNDKILMIRGNHDAPDLCKKLSNCIPDGDVIGDVMFIGGAASIDKQYRTEGIDWWPDEELSIPEFNSLIDKYEKVKPSVVIAHECPDSVADIMMSRIGRTKIQDGSRTRQALQTMFEIHQPALFVFGHWHMPFDEVINNTRFICLDVNTFIDVDLG